MLLVSSGSICDERRPYTTNIQAFQLKKEGNQKESESQDQDKKQIHKKGECPWVLTIDYLSC